MRFWGFSVHLLPSSHQRLCETLDVVSLPVYDVILLLNKLLQLLYPPQ